jgi:hypothetical protein
VIFLLAVLLVNTIALAVVTVLYRKARTSARERRVEGPNSAFESSYVRDVEALERWEQVELATLHEVNREEFERIIEKVRGASARVLTLSERAYMDRMSVAHERTSLRGEGTVRRSARRPTQLPGTP